MTAKYQVTDFTVDDAVTLKAKLDGNSSVAARTVGAFQCYANETPNMTVKVSAGGVFIGGSLLEKAIQTSGTIVAPVSNPRIDRVVIDPTTGIVSIVTGTEAGSPVAPPIPNGYRPLARIALTVGMAQIMNQFITDERVSGVASSSDNSSYDPALSTLLFG